MKTKNITFLGVEKQDEKMVLQKFPKAKIENREFSVDDLCKKYPETEILSVFIYNKITAEIIKKLPNLKLIITRSVGYDHIDLKSADKHEITVCNVPDYGSHVIAEHTFALLLSMVRHIREADEQVERYNFDYEGFRGVALKGKTLGLIGCGKIGSIVARIASMGFLMKVIVFDKFPNKDSALENHFTYTKSIDDVWKNSDIISLHLPLLDSTKHIVNKKSIQKMKNGVILLNTARGGLIDTNDLIEALKSKKISQCALDVLEDEKNNLKFSKKLIDIPNVITTPHIAFYADDSVRKMYEVTFSTIEKFAKKESLKNILG